MLTLPAVVSHRGANRLAPENTLAAFAQAKQLGFSWVELDVQLSQDNLPVVFHDNTLPRTTGNPGTTADYTLNKLQKMPANCHQPSQIKGNIYIPSLVDALTQLHQNNMGCNIELKTHHATNWSNPDQYQNQGVELATITCTYILPYIQKGMPIVLSSFCHHTLQIARQILPNIAIGLLVQMDHFHQMWPTQKTQISQAFDTLDAFSFNINKECLDHPRAIHELKSRFNRLFCYTVNDIDQAKQLLKNGVDSLFSDNHKLIELVSTS